MTGDHVARLVFEAFAEVRAPLSTEIAHCEECEIWVGRFLAGLPSDWRQIADDDIALEYAALTAVTVEAFRFLLPAYIVWHLRHAGNSVSNTAEHLIYQLTRTGSTDSHITDGYESLSPPQVRAVAAFLTFVASRPQDSVLAADAARALASYWRARAV